MATQTWRDQLQPASFKGAPFHVSGTDGQIGRRWVIHEYPLRDLPYAEDMGRKYREFTIEAFVIGANYMAARDRLIDAIEAPGSGELVHPYRGRQQVAITSARVSESSADGGMAKFSLTFTESGEAVNPVVKSDTKAAVKTAADQARSASKSSFLSKFSLDGAQDFVSADSLSGLNASLSGIRTAADGMIGNALMPEFLLELNTLANTATSLLNTPANLAYGMFGMMSGLSGLGGSAMASLSSLRGLFGFGRKTSVNPYATPNRQQQQINHNALIDLTRQAAVIEATNVATTVTPPSFDEAIALRDELAGQLETLAESAEDAVYAALTDLRIAVINDLNARAADLSRTVQHPVTATLPALVIAYRLYGTIDQADSIVARNRISHPGFVAGGRSIEVLTP